MLNAEERSSKARMERLPLLRERNKLLTTIRRTASVLFHDGIFSKYCRSLCEYWNLVKSALTTHMLPPITSNLKNYEPC